MANSAAARGGACGKQYGESCPPPPPGAPPLPSRSPSMSQPRPPAADWLDYRFNAFGQQEPAVGVVYHFWEKLFLSEHDEALWQAALHADIDMVKKIIEATDASVFIPPLQVDFVDDAGNSMELPPKMFLQWGLRHYVILQRMLLSQKKPFDEDCDERYENLIEFLDRQENLVVVQLMTEMNDETEDGKIFSDLSSGTDIIGHRCDPRAVSQVELWQAALGGADHGYFEKKLLSLLPEGVDPLMSCYETQVSHPYACRHWPLRMFCRVGRCTAAAKKLSILVAHEAATITNAAQAIITGQLDLTEKTWLNSIGIAP